MVSAQQARLYYQALLKKNKEYEGIFYVGVKSTGTFCRPTCSTTKPKIKNCEFFQTAKEVLLASYKPCKCCQPLSHSDLVPQSVKTLVEAIESNPSKRWKTQNFREISDPSAERQFKKIFGITLIEYARARRIGLAMKHIRKGRFVNKNSTETLKIDNFFRDAFSEFMPLPSGVKHVLYASWLPTILGPMVAITDNDSLYLLEFVDRRGLELEIERLRKKIKVGVVPGITSITKKIENELASYFVGKSFKFETPLCLIGSAFQKSVWEELKKIPLGEKLSYSDIAKLLNRPKAYRAVANANGANQLAIIIPCHRVINSNGELGGYGGGLSRKQWLLQHEEAECKKKITKFYRKRKKYFSHGENLGLFSGKGNNDDHQDVQHNQSTKGFVRT